MNSSEGSNPGLRPGRAWVGCGNQLVREATSRKREELMIETVQRLYRLLISAASSMQSPFLLAVRLNGEWLFVQTGRGKLNNLEKVTQFFTQLGKPAPDLNTHFIRTLELVGGILLAVGLASRLIPLPLSSNMLVVFVTAD